MRACQTLAWTEYRFQSNRFGCPPFVHTHQFDSLRPMDQPSDSFLFWRWEWDNCLHDMIEKLPSMKSLDELLSADTNIRECWARVPPQLRSSIISIADTAANVVSQSRMPTTLALPDHDLMLQQVRLALHFNTGLLQLHRLGFSIALRQNPVEPSGSAFGVSVTVITREACPNIIGLAELLYTCSTAYSRHMVCSEPLA